MGSSHKILRYLKLREYISQRYREKHGFNVPVENILITSGSQQGVDLLGKTFLNEGDGIVIEEPVIWGLFKHSQSINQPLILFP